MSGQATPACRLGTLSGSVQVELRTQFVRKRYPLQISRGISEGSTNLFVWVRQGEHVGIGEGAPGTTSDADFAEYATQQLRQVAGSGLLDVAISDLDQYMRQANVEPAAAAALEMAIWDLFGKVCDQPLHRLFGLPLPKAPTSVTIGINPVDVVRERVPELLARTGCRALKVKLGSAEGIERDREMFAAAREAGRPFGVKLRVDANGAWPPDHARAMIAWLADRDCEYVEQPLAEGQEQDLAALSDRPIPIFADESCRTSKDLPKLVGLVDGVNVKLMKTGGLLEALRLLAAARAFGLSTMIGCMGETSIAISAGASISGLCDHADLDSHLNLAPDPAIGPRLENGVVLPSGLPGHGARLKDAEV